MPRRGWKLSKETRKKIGIASSKIVGEKRYNWKGDSVTSIDKKHKRIEQLYGKPNYCEICKRSDRKKYEWSNKDHSYKMPINRDDWQRLCTSCHLKYDYKYNNRKSNKGVLTKLR